MHVLRSEAKFDKKQDTKSYFQLIFYASSATPSSIDPDRTIPNTIMNTRDISEYTCVRTCRVILPLSCLSASPYN